MKLYFSKLFWQAKFLKIDFCVSYKAITFSASNSIWFQKWIWDKFTLGYFKLKSSIKWGHFYLTCTWIVQKNGPQAIKNLNIFRLSNEHPSDCWQPRLGVVRRKTGIWKERLKSSTSTSHSAHWKKLRLGSNENQNKQFYRKIIPSPEFWVQLGSILNEKK